MVWALSAENIKCQKIPQNLRILSNLACFVSYFAGLGKFLHLLHRIDQFKVTIRWVFADNPLKMSYSKTQHNRQLRRMHMVLHATCCQRGIGALRCNHSIRSSTTGLQLFGKPTTDPRLCLNFHCCTLQYPWLQDSGLTMSKWRFLTPTAAKDCGLVSAAGHIADISID